MKNLLLTCLLGIGFLTTVWWPPAALAQSPAVGPRLAFAAFRNGQWDIYALAPDGSDLRQLTNDPYEDTDPAYSPDGRYLAYASRRDRNWDIYLLDLQTGGLQRLTDSPHYDAAPAWRPDGQMIAFESYRSGNLDIWLVPPEPGASPTNLTADSQAGDFSPAWRPDGQALAFTSWRTGDRDLFLLNLSGGDVTQLTSSPAAEFAPAWSSDGARLAFTVDHLGDREIFTLDPTRPPADGGSAEQLSWLGRTDAPAWLADSQTVAGLFHRWDGEIIALVDPLSRLPRLLTPPFLGQGRLSWHPAAVVAGQPVPDLRNRRLAHEERLTPNQGAGVEPYNLIRQDNLETGSPWLADTVDDSFQRWREALRSEVGYDFLASLSDVLRDPAAYSDTSQYASWHKSGRAVDTLFDYHIDGQLVHEIVRETYSGETYWRVFLRCADQSGRCGRPLVENPWNYSSRARTEIAPDQGGIEKPIPDGYYVDMTGLGRLYGWERISSYDDVDYSWTWHFLAFEYWHYQNRRAVGPDGRIGEQPLNWYQAMSEVYPPDTLTRYFTWDKMRRLDEDPYLIALKGVPLPPPERPWWRLVQDGLEAR